MIWNATEAILPLIKRKQKSMHPITPRKIIIDVGDTNFKAKPTTEPSIAVTSPKHTKHSFSLIMRTRRSAGSYTDNDTPIKFRTFAKIMNRLAPSGKIFRTISLVLFAFLNRVRLLILQINITYLGIFATQHRV